MADPGGGGGGESAAAPPFFGGGGIFFFFTPEVGLAGGTPLPHNVNDENNISEILDPPLLYMPVEHIHRS